METLNVRPKNKEQLAALKTFMTAFKISFQENKDDNTSYNPEFVEKIKRSQEDFNGGNFKVVKTEDLWK